MKFYCLLIIFLIFPALSSAESYRYMDKAGTIHWVDKLKDVPPEYREQVFPPTPTPSAKTAKEAEQQYKKEVKAREKEYEKRKREHEKKKKDLEKKIKSEQKRIEKEK